MKDREELIWKAVKKCKLESAFWKLTKVFPSTEGMVSVLYLQAGTRGTDSENMV